MVDIDKIISYESGDMNREETIVFFAEMIETGDAYRLQGHYQRVANMLIDNGIISEEGDVLVTGEEY